LIRVGIEFEDVRTSIIDTCQRLRKVFNGHQETDSSLTPLIGVEVYEKVKSIDHTFGKSKKKSSVTNIWKKKINFL